jgi:hypothetical protein
MTLSHMLNNITTEGADDNQAFFSGERERTNIGYSTPKSAIEELQIKVELLDRVWPGCRGRNQCCHKERRQSQNSPVSDYPAASMAEMPVEECGDLAKCLLGFGHAIVELILSVRLTLVDFELRVDASLAELPVHAHRVA